MTQVNTTISDKLNELLERLSELTGISKSSLIAEYVRRGIYEDIRNEARLAEFNTAISQGIPTTIAPATPATDTPAVKMPTTDKRKVR